LNNKEISFVDLEHDIEQAIAKDQYIVLFFIDIFGENICSLNNMINFVCNLKEKHFQHLIICMNFIQLPPLSALLYQKVLQSGICIAQTGGSYVGGSPFTKVFMVPEKQSNYILEKSKLLLSKGIEENIDLIPENFNTSVDMKKSQIDKKFQFLFEKFPVKYDFGLILRLESASYLFDKIRNVDNGLRKMLSVNWITRTKK